MLRAGIEARRATLPIILTSTVTIIFFLNRPLIAYFLGIVKRYISDTRLQRGKSQKERFFWPNLEFG